MPNLYDWKKVTVPVTLHLTEEAAKILYDYAVERSRGKFVSALLVAQRRQDDIEAERIRAAVVSDSQKNSAPPNPQSHTKSRSKRRK